MARRYEFSKLKEPTPGCGYGKYWSWNLKEFGRDFIKTALQERCEDLPEDPWGKGNPNIKDV